MEKNIKSSQKVKNYVSTSSTIAEEQIPAEKVVFYEKGSVSVVSKKPDDLQQLFNVIKSNLHGENDNNSKLCEWQLPPNLKKASCVPVNCIDSDIEKKTT